MDYEELFELSINDLWERLNETEFVEKADTALVLGRRLFDQKSYAESFAVSEQAVRIGEQLSDSRIQGEGWFRLGVCSYHLERYDESADAYLKSVPFFLSESNESKAANAFRLAVDGLTAQQKYEDVVRVCTDALPLAEMADNDHLLADLLSSKGNALYALDLYEDALATFQSARVVWKRQHLVPHVIACDMQMGECYESLGEPERALEFFENAYELSVASDQRKMIVYQGLRLARAYDMLDRFPEAERVLTRAYEVASHHDDAAAMAALNAWMSNIYRQTDRADLAYETASNALTLFEAVEDFDVYDQAVAAAVLHPLAVERQNDALIIKSSKLMLKYYFDCGRELDGLEEHAFVQLELTDALLRQGAPLVDEPLVREKLFLHADLPRHAEWSRRVTASLLECHLVDHNWDELLSGADDYLKLGRPGDLDVTDGRALHLKALAQRALGISSAATLALAASVYFSLSRFDVALELQDEAIQAAVAELTGAPAADSGEWHNKDQALTAEGV